MPLTINAAGLKDLQPHLHQDLYKPIHFRDDFLPLKLRSLGLPSENHRIASQSFNLLKLALKINKHNWNEGTYNTDFAEQFVKNLSHFSGYTSIRSIPDEEAGEASSSHHKESIISSLLEQLKTLTAAHPGDKKKISIINLSPKSSHVCDLSTLAELERKIHDLLIKMPKLQQDSRSEYFPNFAKQILLIRDNLIALSLSVICLCSNHDAMTTLKLLLGEKANVWVIETKAEDVPKPATQPSLLERRRASLKGSVAPPPLQLDNLAIKKIQVKNSPKLGTTSPTKTHFSPGKSDKKDSPKHSPSYHATARAAGLKSPTPPSSPRGS